MIYSILQLGGQVAPSSSALEQFNIINSINTTGNYTNLDDILGYLGTLNVYWWKRRSVGQYEAVVSSSYSTATIVSGSSSYYIYVADSVTASSSGVTLNSPTSSFVNWTSNDNDIIQTIRNKYWYSSAYSNNIYYSCNGFIQTSGYQKTTQSYSVTSQLVTGDWEYVQSTSPSAYPQSGEQDGYEYVYLGVPFENTIEPVKIKSVSYIGTGTYGYGNENTITLPEDLPDYIIISGKSMHNTIMGVASAFIPVFVLSDWVGREVTVSCFYDSSTNYIITELSGNTLSYYANDANSQFNTNRWEYNVYFVYF